MWPFKKKVKDAALKTDKFTTVICIPGAWKDYDDFHNSLIVNNGAEYMVVGDLLLNGKRKVHYTFEFCKRDENLSQAFYYAGLVTGISDHCMEEIKNHQYVVFVSGQTGSLEDAYNIALAASGILKAGGIAVKIETAGKAFEKKKWFNFFNNFKFHLLYHMFVVDSITDEDGNVYSCGMQNLGYKDTFISGEDFQSSVSLIKLFNIYQIVDKPTLKHHETFRPDETALYRIIDMTKYPNKGQRRFGNPNGMWKLQRAGN